MPLINSAEINSAKTTENYDVISNVGVWSYVTNGSKSGWTLTEKTTVVEVNNNTQTTTQEQPEQTKPQETEQKPQEEEQKPVSTEKAYSKAKTYYVKLYHNVMLFSI